MKLTTAANLSPVPEWPPGGSLVPQAFRQLLGERLECKANDRRYLVGRWITRAVPGQRNPRAHRPLTTTASAKGYWLMSTTQTNIAELKDALSASGAVNIKQHPSPLPGMNVLWFDLPKS